MTEKEKLLLAIEALIEIKSMPMQQFSYHKAFTRAVERAEHALSAMNVKLPIKVDGGSEQ